MNEIEVLWGSSSQRTESFVFPGGEIQVRLPGMARFGSGDMAVVARLQSAESVVRLVLATEAISDACGRAFRTLVVPYFPYARQDRVMQPGEAFSLKAMARLINALAYDRVVICDPHSDVTPALVDRVEVVSQLDLVKAHAPLSGMLSEDIDVIVSPDAGAAKKSLAVARHCGLPQVVASKVRDTRTGEITATELQNPGMVAGRSALIVDDICDGGRTFVELARVLRDAGASAVYLYVTHGIFSKGFEGFRGIIDGIYTTDSFAGVIPCDGPVPVRVSVLKFNTRGIVL